MNNILWIILAVIFSVIEIFTFNMVTIWFVAGSVFALFASLVGSSTLVQVWVFAISTLLCLIFTKPFISKKLSFKKTSTNADRIIGMTGIVTEDIKSNKFSGKVKVNGQEWSAVCIDNGEKNKGDVVTVKDIQGVRLFVEWFNII